MPSTDLTCRLASLCADIRRALNQEVIDYNEVALYAEFALSRAYEMLLLNGGDFALQQTEAIIERALQVMPCLMDFLAEAEQLLCKLASVNGQAELADVCAQIVEPLLHIKVIAMSKMNKSEYLI